MALAGKCLVTGGAGFIGANLIRCLLPSCGLVRVLDNLSSGRREDLDGLDVEFIQGDIRDVDIVDRAVTGMEKVVHLAADTEVIQSVEDPKRNLDVNVIGTFNLLRSSLKHGVERFVFASTGGAIVGDVVPPVTEEMVPHPISPYGASKLAGEGYCSAFWGAYGLKTISLRFSNVYGPFSYHKGSVIAKFFRQMRSGSPLTIYGNGEQTRDFVFAEDLSKAITGALEAPLPFGGSIQLGTGSEISINHLVGKLRSLVGSGKFPPVQFAPPRPGEVSRNFVSIARAKDCLGFSPVVDLETGLQRTWDWFSHDTQVFSGIGR